jgi:hypothetical protein
MGMARLNVWVTEIGNPCRMDQETEIYVHVLHCDGKVLEWCGERKWNLKAECGHVEVEVPPGCYMVCSTQGLGSERPDWLGNNLSHVAVVRANCDDHVCVTLFQPTLPFCGVWWLTALREHVDRGTVDVGREVLESIERVVESLPRDPVTENMMVLAEGRRRRG